MKYFLILLTLTTNAFGQNLTIEVAETTKLRQEVELLSQEVEALKKTQQAEMDVYIQRYQEVEASVLREKFRQDQLQTQIKLGKNKLEAHSKVITAKGSQDWLRAFWAKYQSSLQAAHPLVAPKLQERIEKLKVDLAFKKISYEHALLQTWFVLETDLNRAQDAEFVLAPLQIGEKLYHVEMVRMGRTQGYFRTAEGKYGLLHFNQKWDAQFFDDAKAKGQIEALLGQFKQQQKTGLYSLPGIKL